MQDLPAPIAGWERIGNQYRKLTAGFTQHSLGAARWLAYVTYDQWNHGWRATRNNPITTAGRWRDNQPIKQVMEATLFPDPVTAMVAAEVELSGDKV
mgnify:CR=1 FL=1